MSSLPVSAVLDELLAALQSAPQVLLHAPTGAGKSTWLPLQILAKAGLPGRIIMLEPRRLAAKNVAYRLAQQLGEEPGQTVGYRMRAESKSGPQTRLEVVTEGILTRMLQQDAELQGVSLVILDEFHERSLQADLALALLLDVQQGLRDDLKLLIMSATLDNARLSQLLPEAPVVASEGRSFPVERQYQPLASHQRLEDGVAAAVKRLLAEQPGSLLLFLPGVAEINRVLERLTGEVASDTDLCPLYGALPLAQQQKAIQPAAWPPQGGAGDQHRRNQPDDRGHSAGGGQRPGARGALRRAQRFDAAGDAAHQPGLDGAACRARRAPGAGPLLASVRQRTGGTRGGTCRTGYFTERSHRLLARTVAVGLLRSGAADLA